MHHNNLFPITYQARHLLTGYFQVTWKFKTGEGKNYFNCKRTSFTFVQFPVKINFKSTSVEQHTAFLKAQRLLLLKEVGSFESNTKGRAVILKTSVDKKDAVNVHRITCKALFIQFLLKNLTLPLCSATSSSCPKEL